jgi:hypothetical protein
MEIEMDRANIGKAVKFVGNIVMQVVVARVAQEAVDRVVEKLYPKKKEGV